MSPPRILLTGGTGFVGAQILKHLKDQGAYIRLITRQKNYQGPADDIVVTCDMFSESTAWWSAGLDNIDIVIHSAWYVEPGKYLFADENAACLEGSLRLKEAFMSSKAEHFVGIGTCFEYDTSAGYLSIQTPLQPETPYAKAKVDLFKALSQIPLKTNKTYAWCRLFYLYGENENPKRLVPYLHQQLQQRKRAALTSGLQIRDFMDVRDAGQKIAKVALEHKQGPFNICSGKAITVRELAVNIANQYSQADLLDFGARKDNPVDPPIIVGVSNL